MLVSSKLSKVPTVDRLVNIWTSRYFPDLSTLSINHNSLVRSKLREDSSIEGRRRAAKKLPKQLIQRKCELAAVRTKALYAHNEPAVLKEVAHLAQSASRIYLKLLEVYQESAPIVISSKGNLWETVGDTSLEVWGIPRVNKLADTLETLLLELQEQHMVSGNWRSLGFITTQINLSNALLLEPLTSTEQVLINPYFKFLEEQVALPWQRVCAAAAKHNLTSPAFSVVEKMLPKASEISVVVFKQWSTSFPSYSSHRGNFKDTSIQHSSLRDFDMFQAYLWLCFLEGNSTFAEQELAAICIIVFGILNIPWTMTVEGNKFLVNEILNRLDPQQKELVRPYTQSMLKVFSER